MERGKPVSQPYDSTIVKTTTLKSAVEALAFSYLTLNDTGMVAEYRFTAQDGRVEYFPVLGGSTELLAYVSDLSSYVQTSAMQAALNPILVGNASLLVSDEDAGIVLASDETSDYVLAGDENVDENEYFAVLTDATTARTLAITDAGKYIRCTSSSSVSVTVPPQSSVSWVSNTEIIVERAGTGSLTIVAGSGVTLVSPRTLVADVRYSCVTLKRVAINTWVVAGGTV